MSNPLIFGERRLYDRKACAFSVSIAADNGQYRALLRNLSAGGALIEAPSGQRQRVGQEVVLTIPFQKKRGNVVIKGKVARVKHNGVAISFVKSLL